MNNFSGPKAVIFGVTGQDGFYLTKLLLEQGYEVYGVGRRSSVNNTVRLQQGEPSLLTHSCFHYLVGDVTDPISINNIIKSVAPDEVYNLAAQSHVYVSFEQPVYTWKVVAEGPLYILETICELSPMTKYYQASSSEMYGAGLSWLNSAGEEEHGATPDVKYSPYQAEGTPMLPCSPYAIAKLAGYHTTKLYREAYGIHASNGILFNHESELRQEHFVSRKITQYVARLQRAIENKQQCEKLRLGNIYAYRDWGYAGDYVEAMYMMLQQDTPSDYVIATGQTHTVEDFLKEAFLHIGITDYREYVQVDANLFRPSEVPYLCGNSAKARAKLGWTPKVSFQELVKLMVDYDIRQIYGN